MKNLDELKKDWEDIKASSYDEDYVLSELIEELIFKLQRYEGMVKKVDPNNLTDEEVYIWCKTGLILGYLFVGDNNEVKVCSRYPKTYNNPTHYIDKESLDLCLEGTIE